MSTMIILSTSKTEGSGPLAAFSEQKEKGESDFHKLVELEERLETEPGASAPSTDPGSDVENEEQFLEVSDEPRLNQDDADMAGFEAEPALGAKRPPDAEIAEDTSPAPLLMPTAAQPPVENSLGATAPSSAGPSKNAQQVQSVLALQGTGIPMYQTEQGKIQDFDAVSGEGRTIPVVVPAQAQANSASVEVALLPLAAAQLPRAENDGRIALNAADIRRKSGEAQGRESVSFSAPVFAEAHTTAPPAQNAQTVSRNAAARLTGDRAAFGDADLRIAPRLFQHLDESVRLAEHGAVSQFHPADRLQVTTPVARPEVARSVAQQISATILARPGTNTVDIELDPVELGRVSMVLRSVDDGLSLSISAERSETMDLMRRHVSELTETFRELGYENISFNFGEKREDRDDGSRQEKQNRPGTTAGNVQPQTEARTVLSLSPTGVDMRL